MTKPPGPIRVSRTSLDSGWLNGLVGVLLFSGSLPATRVAVFDFDPLFLTFARATVAGLMAVLLLRLGRVVRPLRTDLMPLAVVATGVVVGYPLLSALALRHVTSVRAILFVGLLPLATALFAVLRAGERPRLGFWAFATLGAALVAGYALGRGSEGTLLADGLMVAAVFICGLGYAEGGRLSRRLGGWQVICWALVLSLPLMAPAALLTAPVTWAGIGWPAWTGLAYVSVFSMLVGFVFWYRGLAQGGVAAVGQLQLTQPFFGLLLAGLLLGEPVGWGLVLVLAAVVTCVAGAKRFAK